MDSSKGSQDAGAQYADQGTGYESVQGGLQQGAQQHDMGGGRGAMGSGVAGGHEGSASSNNASGNTSNVSNDASAAQGAPAEKKDWLDKGFEAVGKKAGYSMVSPSRTLRNREGEKGADETCGCGRG